AGERPAQRLAFSADAPGPEALLEPFAGRAIGEVVPGASGPRLLPVRLTAVRGVMPDPVAAHPALIDADYQAPRRGAAAPRGVVVLRPRVPYGPLVHVATGRAPDDLWAIVAAHIRTRRTPRG